MFSPSTKGYKPETNEAMSLSGNLVCFNAKRLLDGGPRPGRGRTPSPRCRLRRADPFTSVSPYIKTFQESGTQMGRSVMFLEGATSSRGKMWVYAL